MGFLGKWIFLSHVTSYTNYLPAAFDYELKRFDQGDQLLKMILKTNLVENCRPNTICLAEDSSIGENNFDETQSSIFKVPDLTERLI